MPAPRSILTAAVLFLLTVAAQAEPHPWKPAEGAPGLEEEILPPAGFVRTAGTPGSFTSWLRTLPLKPSGSPVLLFDGRRKGRQDVHFRVLDLDVGKRDLQQCADAVMRLRAEYQWAAGCREAIAFDFTSGDEARWSRWAAGERPRVSGSEVRWQPGASPSSSYQSFRSYLDSVFTYAGSASLQRELDRVPNPNQVQPGDVWIQGGYPGHAVVVLDVVVTDDDRGTGGDRVRMLLGQSYMPAQEIHVLARPGSTDPWFPVSDREDLVTPEWTFAPSDLHRFAEPDCSPGAGSTDRRRR